MKVISEVNDKIHDQEEKKA